VVLKFLPALAALAVGVAVGAFAVGSGRSDAPARDDTGAGAQPGAQAGSDYARIIDGLSATLELEVVERQRLESQIEDMSLQLARLERALAEAQLLASDAPGNAREDAASLLAATEAEALQEENEERSALAPFLEAGFDPARAEYVKQLQDDLVLQRLYLRDQAEREGWLRTPRYRDAMEALNAREQGLRAELGTQDYDRYLYAIGQPNRVLVGDVLENGPAQLAGIQAGDAILSYGGERIYDASTLVRETRDGSGGMSTAVEIERDGQTQVVYVPRGPLGINLRVARVRPSD
jgi:C-terminal processing protease CtpA/Prc